MTRSIIKAAEWTLGTEAGEGATQNVHKAVCRSCGAESPATDGGRLPVEVWVLKHTGMNPDHRRFRATAETFWRVTPAESNPYHGTAGS